MINSSKFEDYLDFKRKTLLNPKSNCKLKCGKKLEFHEEIKDDYMYLYGACCENKIRVKIPLSKIMNKKEIEKKIMNLQHKISLSKIKSNYSITKIEINKDVDLLEKYKLELDEIKEKELKKINQYIKEYDKLEKKVKQLNKELFESNNIEIQRDIYKKLQEERNNFFILKQDDKYMYVFDKE